MREADTRTRRALGRLIGHRTLSLKALAEDLGIAYATIHSWTRVDGPVPTLAQVRSLLLAASRYDADAARELAAEVYGIGDAGWLLAAAPRPGPTAQDMVREVLEASAATGAVTGWAAEAAPGGISPAEADVGGQLLHAAQVQLAEAAAVVRRFKAPQGVLPGVPA